MHRNHLDVEERVDVVGSAVAYTCHVRLVLAFQTLRYLHVGTGTVTIRTARSAKATRTQTWEVAAMVVCSA